MTSIDKVYENLNKFTKNEIQDFFEAFFTKMELKSLEDRIAIANCLANGMTQAKICEQLNVSASKVTAGSKEYQYGKGKIIFDKISKL